jgi:hypothetical protein
MIRTSCVLRHRGTSNGHLELADCLCCLAVMPVTQQVHAANVHVACVLAHGAQHTPVDPPVDYVMTLRARYKAEYTV